MLLMHQLPQGWFLAVCFACRVQVREEEIEAENRERVQKRSTAMLASKANKFASIHTERLKTFRQLATAKVCLAAAVRSSNSWHAPTPADFSMSRSAISGSRLWQLSPSTRLVDAAV